MTVARGSSGRGRPVVLHPRQAVRAPGVGTAWSASGWGRQAVPRGGGGRDAARRWCLPPWASAPRRGRAAVHLAHRPSVACTAADGACARGRRSPRTRARATHHVGGSGREVPRGTHRSNKTLRGRGDVETAAAAARGLAVPPCHPPPHPKNRALFPLPRGARGSAPHPARLPPPRASPRWNLSATPAAHWFRAPPEPAPRGAPRSRPRRRAWPRTRGGRAPAPPPSRAAARTTGR